VVLDQFAQPYALHGVKGKGHAVQHAALQTFIRLWQRHAYRISAQRLQQGTHGGRGKADALAAQSLQIADFLLGAENARMMGVKVQHLDAAKICMSGIV